MMVLDSGLLFWATLYVYIYILVFLPTLAIQQKGYFGSQMFICPYFCKASTFCINYDQKSLFALMSCESINFRVVSRRISELAT